MFGNMIKAKAFMTTRMIYFGMTVLGSFWNIHNTIGYIL